MMHNQNTNSSLRQLAREKALYRYSRALERGDFETVGVVLAEAQADPVLEYLINELNQGYLAEMSKQPAVSTEGLPDLLDTGLTSSLQPLTGQPEPLRLPAQKRPADLTGAILEGDSMRFATNQRNRPKTEATELPTLTSSPYLEPEGSQTNRKRYWPLALVASLVLVCALVMILVLAQDRTGSNPTRAGSVAGAIPAQVKTEVPDRNSTSGSGFQLGYPGATRLTVKEEDIFPNGRPPMFVPKTLGAFATTDNYQKVSDYYNQNLTSAGYKVSPHKPNNCSSAACSQASDLVALNDKEAIEFSIYSAPAWNAMHNGEEVNPFISPKLLKELQPEQTLIFYTFEPLDTQPAGEPVPTVTPAVPVAITRHFLGPDNVFHPDNGTALVSSGPSSKATTSAGANTIFQLDWLVSDPTGTYAQMTFEYSDRLLDREVAGMDTIGTLTDQNGHTYDLTAYDGNVAVSRVNGKQQRHFILTGPTLPATVSKLSFKAGNSLSYSLTSPLSIELVSAAGAPQAVALPRATAEVNGIKVKVPYAYFGSDRTVLDVLVDASGSDKADGYYYNPLGTNDPHLTILDDKGQALSAPGTGSSEKYSRDTDLPGNETMLVLKPLPAGTKQLTLKLDGLAAIQLGATVKRSDPSDAPAPAPAPANNTDQTIPGLWQIVLPVS